MTDYVKSLEQQNEELRNRLTEQETLTQSFMEFFGKFLDASQVVDVDYDAKEEDHKHQRKIVSKDLYYDIRKVPPYLKDMLPMLEKKYAKYKMEREAKKNNGFSNFKDREQDMFDKIMRFKK